MTLLEALSPTPRKLELDHVDLALPVERAWELVRHGDLGRSPLVRALFLLRTLPSRAAHEAVTLTIDGLTSRPEHPGFQILGEAPFEVVVGAIGKVWQPDIPFVHVPDGAAFAAFSEPDYVKVCWSLRVEPRGQDARVLFELRVDATDEAAWKKFQRYFLLIGPGSHFIRRSILSALAHEHGTPESKEDLRPLPGDALIADPRGQITHGITIEATPEAIWPWLVQMGGQRAGFYSVDVLDNGGVPSAREIHPELQDLRVGQVIAASPEGRDGFEVLSITAGVLAGTLQSERADTAPIDAPRALILGGLFDPEANRQLPFATARPSRFWQVTWAFVLEPLTATSTRLHVRVRAAFSDDQRLHAAWIAPVHHFMEAAQLRHLKMRAEGRAPRDDLGDILEGVGGAAIMVAGFLSPFARHARSHWGIDQATADRRYPGDELIEAPRWGWTHGIEIDAPIDTVWPWVAQIGAGRGGFYSYQWLENVVGCEVHNAEVVHPEWEVQAGQGLSLHPKMPPIPIVALEPGQYWVAYGGPDSQARANGKPWMATSWLFHLESLAPNRTRFISRFRCASSDDLLTRLQFGAGTLEPIGFAMDRRMLLGVKQRAER